MRSTARRLLVAWLIVLPAASAAQPPPPRYEHRVVVSTTELDAEREVDASLARNVNALAAVGYQLSAFVGGDGAAIDSLLARKPYAAGLVDHGGQVLVVMHRPENGGEPREYRLLHTRTHLGVEAIVAGHARDGFRLTVTAAEGATFHAAFERAAGPPVEYRVLRTERRQGWDQQLVTRPDLRGRVRRVVPMSLETALVELGAEAAPAAEFVWVTDKTHERPRINDRLATHTATGFRVQHVRMRGTNLDIALLKPAGTTGGGVTAALEDGPWGGPCGRGVIAGADLFSDGDVYCVAEAVTPAVSNRGFDLVVTPEPDLGPFFGLPSCEIRARLTTTRTSATRIARALQFERELNRRNQEGYRVSRAWLGGRPDDTRLVVIATRDPREWPTRASSTVVSSPAPALRPELDAVGQQLLRQAEEDLNRQLEREPELADVKAWVEISNSGAVRQVQLLGCATHRLGKERAEAIVRSLLVRTQFSNLRLRNQIIVDFWR